MLVAGSGGYALNSGTHDVSFFYFGQLRSFDFRVAMSYVRRICLHVRACTDQIGIPTPS